MNIFFLIVGNATSSYVMPTLPAHLKLLVYSAPRIVEVANEFLVLGRNSVVIGSAPVGGAPAALAAAHALKHWPRGTHRSVFRVLCCIFLPSQFSDLVETL